MLVNYRLQITHYSLVKFRTLNHLFHITDNLGLSILAQLHLMTCFKIFIKAIGYTVLEFCSKLCAYFQIEFKAALFNLHNAHKIAYINNNNNSNEVLSTVVLMISWLSTYIISSCEMS